ncbi:MAG: hypothetical protein ABIG11_11000, partial [bacterium]
YLIFGEENAADLNTRVQTVKKELDELRNEHEQKHSIVVKFICTSENVLSNNGESIFRRFQNDLQTKNIDIDYEKINDKKLSAIFSEKSILQTPMPIKLSGKFYYSL